MLRHFFIAILLSALPLHAQQTAQPNTTSAQEVAASSKMEALEQLVLSLQVDERDLEKLNNDLRAATIEEQKKEINAEITKLAEKIKGKKQEISATATGISTADTISEAPKPFSVKEEIGNIFAPMMREVREATSQPREIENLTIQIQEWEKQRLTSENAIKELEKTLAAQTSPELKKRLTSLLKSWQKKEAEAKSQADSLRIQLEERKKNAPSIFSLITKALSHFWKNRGLSLLIALVACIATFWSCRRIYRFACRYSPIHLKSSDSITARLLDVLANAFAIVSAFIVSMLVLYVRNDWLLLTAAFVLLVGLAWASRTALPPYLEQIRLILNLGNVRIGERLILNGLPWHVKSLNFVCTLHNPELTGGTLRLPAKVLLGHHSRPNMPKEPWFPSKIDDWVKLDDGTFGKIVQQTPEQVVIVKLGGSYKTFLTTNFLAKNPENISNRFRVSTTFGLDYQYQAIATTTIPKLIQAKVLHLLLEKYSRESIISVNVEFASAATSSLDYMISADVHGDIASQHEVLIRLLQRAAVDAANENNWVIPSPQLTIHQP